MFQCQLGHHLHLATISDRPSNDEDDYRKNDEITARVCLLLSTKYGQLVGIGEIAMREWKNWAGN